MGTNRFSVVDTHAHIGDSVFDQDRTEVLGRARTAGVGAVIAVGESMADAERNLDLTKSHLEIRAAAGLYPTRLDMKEADGIISLVRKERALIVALGEIGLDYWVVKEEAERELQREIFVRFIELGLELELPLNVHSRSAGRHAIALLLERGATGVQLHAFDGKAATALPAVEAGYFFSIPPSIVRSRQKQKLVKQLPLSSLLIETDSPVLGPEHDKRNEPANALISVQAIAEIKGIREEEVIEAAASNTRSLYGDFESSLSENTI
jgi:TatD DNase family protein